MSTFNKSKDHNVNYLASIVKLDNIRKHNNADKLQIASVFANNVITGLTAKAGDLYVYFPLESAISSEFLAFTNSFSDKEMNSDKSVKGYFDKNGRVRAVTLRGEKSEGYMVPASELQVFIKKVLNKDVVISDIDAGTDFDEIEGHILCKKYVPAFQRQQATSAKKKTKGSVKKYESKLVENQFRFHYDTEQLKRNMHKISPDDYISLTNKLHGTSFVVSHVLVKKKLSWKDKVAKFFKVSVHDTSYDMLYSSRCVIKNQNFETNPNLGFYGSDIWKTAAEYLFPLMKQGISVYGELVGYTPTGAFIQKDYDYGCNAKEAKIYIYRVTYTSPSGDVYEFSHKQVAEWCKSTGVNMVPEFYYGKAKDLYPDISVDEHWHENYLNRLIQDYLEKDCDLCVSKPKIPAEGIVLRKDSVHDYSAFKLKSFRFLQKETQDLDAGILDIESEQKQNVEEV